MVTGALLRYGRFAIKWVSSLKIFLFILRAHKIILYCIIGDTSSVIEIVDYRALYRAESRERE